MMDKHFQMATLLIAITFSLLTLLEERLTLLRRQFDFPEGNKILSDFLACQLRAER